MSINQDVSDSSISSRDIGDDEKQVHIFVKQMLQSRLFVGKFQEKRYVDSLQSYRDLILIDKDETDFIRALEIVKKRVRKFYGPNHWIGITEPNSIGAPVGNCVWAELSDEIFGSHWYKIAKVKFNPNEVLIRLKVVRPATTGARDTPNIQLRHSTPVQANSKQVSSEWEINFEEKLNNLKIIAKDYLTSFFTTVLTFHNTKEALKFISVLIVVIFTGSIQFLEYLGNFSIRFMRELSNFTHAATPIVIAFINLIGRIVGGFYLLILGMWRDRKSAPSIYQGNIHTVSQSMPNYNTGYYRRALPAPTRYQNVGGPVITPLD